MKIMTQAQARERGLTRFFTGKPCVRGHIAPRQTSNFRCVKCGFMKVRAYYKKNPTVKNSANRRQYRALREEVLGFLGSECECCGEYLREFLCIDHRKGGGRKHRKMVNSVKLLRQIRRQAKIDLKAVIAKYRILCWNCNSAVHFFGVCPHQGERPIARRGFSIKSTERV